MPFVYETVPPLPMHIEEEQKSLYEERDSESDVNEGKDELHGIVVSNSMK